MRDDWRRKQKPTSSKAAREKHDTHSAASSPPLHLYAPARKENVSDPNSYTHFGCVCCHCVRLCVFVASSVASLSFYQRKLLPFFSVCARGKIAHTYTNTQKHSTVYFCLPHTHTHAQAQAQTGAVICTILGVQILPTRGFCDKLRHLSR